MHAYGKDLNAWANEQARLLRAGRFNLLDVEHIAGEIEDVGKSEQRGLASLLPYCNTHVPPFLISAYMASGARSSSPGQVTAPCSTNTWAKSAGSAREANTPAPSE